MELRRRVVSVASRARSALGGNHTLLLEIPDHPRGQTHRLAGGADSWKLFRIAAVVSWWHMPVIYHTSVSFGGCVIVAPALLLTVASYRPPRLTLPTAARRLNPDEIARD